MEPLVTAFYRHALIAQGPQCSANTVALEISGLDDVFSRQAGDFHNKVWLVVDGFHKVR